MSFLYPRTIAVTRPGAQSSSAVGYQGQAPSDQQSLETLVVDGLPASIQAKASGGNTTVGLPADAGQPNWTVFIPRSAAPLGLIRDRDIVTDDLGNRFQVKSDYWNSLGYALRCQRLEA